MITSSGPIVFRNEWSMSAKNIILVIPSRLLRGLLNRALGKAENLVVVETISHPEFLPNTVWETDIDWIILSSDDCHGLPEWIVGLGKSAVPVFTLGQSNKALNRIVKTLRVLPPG